MHIIIILPNLSNSPSLIMNFWVLITRLRIASLVEFPSHFPPFLQIIFFSQYSQANINKQICKSKNCITKKKSRKVYRRIMPQFSPQTIQVMFYAFAITLCTMRSLQFGGKHKKNGKDWKKRIMEIENKRKRNKWRKMKGEEEEFPLKQSTSFFCFLRKVSTTSFLVLSIITLNIFMNIFVV